MAKKYQVTDLPRQFKGYVHKQDVTSLNDIYLVPPSQNVLYDDGGAIRTRGGFTLDGAASTTTNPVRRSYDWRTSRGTEVNLRITGTVIQARFNSAWASFYTLAVNTDNPEFSEYWDTTEQQDWLLFVLGNRHLYEWSGGITTFASATATTITKQTTVDAFDTWVEAGFHDAGTRQVIIGSTTYTYTGGESTATLTGVTPDPTAGGHTAGDVIHQAVRVTQNVPTSADYTNNLIATLNNQVYIGSNFRRIIYVSVQNSISDFTPAATRTPGDAAQLYLDETPTAFISQEEVMYISTRNFWYQIIFEAFSLTAEAANVKRLKTSPLSGARTQASVARIGNEIMFVSNEPKLRSLGRVENVETPQFRDLSDPIKLDFDDYDFTNVHLLFNRSHLYVAVPVEGFVLPYNVTYGFWESPQVLPVRRLAIVGGLIYGHSSAVIETYRLFNGTNDNAGAMEARAAFNYQQFGEPDALKRFDEYLAEGYISSNTKLTLGVKYDFGGFTSIQEFTILGDDNAILFQTAADGSFGKNPIGSQPIGSVTDTLDDLAKFRVIKTTAPTDFFEMQVVFETNDIDFQWKILRMGPASQLSPNQPNSIKQ